MKKLFFALFCFSLAAVIWAQTADSYQVSTSAKPNMQDISNLKKLQWAITINGKSVFFDAMGKMLNGPISFGNKVRNTDPISGIEYLAVGSTVILSVGYENDDTSYALFYTVDSGFSSAPQFIANSTGFGASQFLSNGDKVFEATQFSYHFFDLKTKKDIWNNTKGIGDDCHYNNQVQYLGNNTVKIVYTHYVQNMKKFASMTISLKDGNEIKK
jgi:hypothetical protein